MAATKNLKTSQRGELSIEQHRVIDLLVQGKSDRTVAEAVGVTGETITRWRNENPFFIAALNRKREELWSAAHDKLRGLVGKAIETLQHALENGDVKAAVDVLKAIKLYGHVGAPNSETDPELVLVQQAEEWASQELKRQGPAEDPRLDLLVYNGAKARLIKQRLEALRKTYL